jgi:hypothetical protein
MRGVGWARVDLAGGLLAEGGVGGALAQPISPGAVKAMGYARDLAVLRLATARWLIGLCGA